MFDLRQESFVKTKTRGLKGVPNFHIVFFSSYFSILNFERHFQSNRDAIPEEGPGCTKSLPKQRHQLLISKPSPKNTRDRNRNMQMTSLLAHNSSSESETSDVEHGKLMKPNKQRNNFTLGDSDNDDGHRT